MAHKVKAADLWKGFTGDKIFRFQQDLMSRTCQMTRSSSCQGLESKTGTDYRDRFKIICFQCYQMMCSCFWSWSSILLDHSRKAVSFSSSLTHKAFNRRGDLMKKLTQLFSLWLSFATRAMQWRCEMMGRLLPATASRISSFCSSVQESSGKHQMSLKRKLCQIQDLVAELRDQSIQFPKRVVYIVNCKVVVFLGVVAAQALLVFFLHKYRGNPSTVKACERAHELPQQHMPSAWYYEHIHHYPRPQMKILTAEDGAPAILSQLPVNSREITIATHTTMDRFPAVEMTAFRWSGPMVLVVLVRSLSEIASTYSALEDLHSRVEAEGRCRLHIQIVREDGFKNEDQELQALYPVNSMRNLALGMVTTQLVLMIDADFVPNPGLHEHLTQNEEKFMNLLKRADEWKQLLVVPAFQLIEDKSIQYINSLHVLPHTKEELREGWWNGIVDCFLCDVSPDSHQPTEYYKFTDPAVTWPYEVWYKEGYEPFYIGSMNHLPKFDARFRGHGKNKISHTYLLSVKGFTFWVIPEGFLVELPHPPSLSEKRKIQDPLQTWRIDGIYNRFISEVNWIYNITTVPKTSEITKEILC